MPEKVGFSRMKLVRRKDMPPPPVERAPYIELGVASPFSFLRGASDAIELTLRALELGMDSIGIADRNTLAGVVRMHSACKEAGLRPLIGCRLDLTDSGEVKSGNTLTLTLTSSGAPRNISCALPSGAPRRSRFSTNG